MADDGAALAAELAARADAEARMAAALVELERHPGHVTLAAGVCTGVTAERWTNASVTLAGLWQDFATYRGVLDAARARPAERRRLLREASVEVARTPVALAQRGLTGATETVETITLDALAARMDTAFRAVTDVVTACDAAQRTVFAALVPLADQARAALEQARDLDPADPEHVRLTTALAEVERACVHDPLALADRPLADVLAPLRDVLDPVVARTRQLAAVRDGWESAVAELGTAVAAAAALRNEAAAAQHRAHELIAGADPVAADPVAPLRARLGALPAVVGWAARADALAALRTDVAAAVSALTACRDDALGLVERRSELRGRFDAYRAKAGRLGVAERADLLAAGDRVRDLLWTRPCDLAAATVALVDYQRMIRDGGSGS